MNRSDLLKMSFQNLLRRKTRAVLTVLGVVIGTCSIIVMMSLAIAMETNFKEQLAQMGDLTIIQVFFSGMYGPKVGSQQAKLDDNAVAAFEKIPGVEAVLAEKQAFMKVVVGRMVGSFNLVGVDPEKLKYFKFDVEEGRMLTSTDKASIICGNMVSTNLYNPRMRNQQMMGPGMTPTKIELLNKKIQISTDPSFGEPRRPDNNDSETTPPKPHEITVVGILRQSNDEKDWSAYISLSALEKILAEDQRASRNSREQYNQNQDKYQTIKVKVPDLEQVQPVQEKIKAMGYQTQSLTDMVESMKKTSRTLMAILGGIGAVSLFVSAIGIANTMIMSIYERTREIGIIKVLGADLPIIEKLFLLEAAMIGFGGGVLGLFLSYLISFILNHGAAAFAAQLGGTRVSVIPVGLGLAGVAFATLVGVISGYAPARRAMKLSALEAIRNE